MELDILTRFKSDDGRVYVFNHNFDSVYKNIPNAVRHFNDTIHKESLEEVRGRAFSLVNAIMWGSDEGDKMIDFFGIGPNYSLDGDWNSNPDVFSWVTRNGLIVPGKNISEVTCGKGLIILGEEERYRRSTLEDSYLSIPPKIGELKLMIGDYATPEERENLLSLIASQK
ncbi:MAG: hypothetical protein AABW51_01705 [Nanoarchaeota archaeon]